MQALLRLAACPFEKTEVSAKATVEVCITVFLKSKNKFALLHCKHHIIGGDIFSFEMCIAIGSYYIVDICIHI